MPIRTQSVSVTVTYNDKTTERRYFVNGMRIPRAMWRDIEYHKVIADSLVTEIDGNYTRWHQVARGVPFLIFEKHGREDVLWE